MGKTIKQIVLCLCIVLLIMGFISLTDKQRLADSIIRFHVVANSDSQEDQEVKLLVRDAVIQSIQQDLENVADVEQARDYLNQNLPKIQNLANSVLKAAGLDENAVVSFEKEAFPIREYDTFSLPSGVYQALRIVIGEGRGHNWWCVTFPAMCLPATSSGFVETASQAGLPMHISNSLANDGKYEVHFFLMDIMGKMENSFLWK